MKAGCYHLLILFGLSLLISCVQPSSPQNSAWRSLVRQEVNALGYGNTIVVADASYPYQNIDGFRTITVPEETPEVIAHILESINEKQHLKPDFYVSSELRAIMNNQAPGIDLYRYQLASALKDYPIRELENSLLTSMSSENAKQYTVLVIKTETTLPYSAVYLELDSGYWNNNSEQALRAKIAEEKLPR